MPKGIGQVEKEKPWPPWLYPLLRTAFFGPCKLHGQSSRTECNMYCLDCTNGALCSSCLFHHQHHRAIQIRRSSYHDVIRVAEIQKLVDISGVQTYVINGARVVFLNERPQPKGGKGAANACCNCRRSLLETFSFCSLGCKLARSGASAPQKLNIVTPMALQPSLESDGSADESEDSYRHCPLDCISSSTSSPMIITNRAKRRKGIPQRSPMGVY